MSVSTLVLLGLAVVWAIVLLPEVLKRVSKARSGDSIQSFNSQLSSLQRRPAGGSNVVDLRSAQRRAQPGRAGARPTAGPRSAGRPAPVPATVSQAVCRSRQEVLTVLGSASVLTLLCSVAFGGPFLLLFLISAGLLVAYVFALYQVTNAAAASAARDPYGRPSVAPGPRPTDLPGVRISPVSARRIAN